MFRSLSSPSLKRPANADTPYRVHYLEVGLAVRSILPCYMPLNELERDD